MNQVHKADDWLNTYFTARTIFKDIYFYLEKKHAGTLEMYIREKVLWEIIFLNYMFPQASLPWIERLVHNSMQQAVQHFEQKLLEKESEGKEHVHSGIVSEREAH